MVYSTKAFRREASILFLVAMIVGGVNLLLSQNGNVPAVLKTLVVVAFGVLLVISAVLLLRRR